MIIQGRRLPKYTMVGQIQNKPVAQKEKSICDTSTLMPSATYQRPLLNAEIQKGK